MESLEIMQRTADSLAAAMAIGDRATTQAQNCKTLVAQLRLLASFLDTLIMAETQAAAAAGPAAGKGSGRGVSFAILVQNLDTSVRDAAALLQRCALPPSRVYSAVRSDMMEHQFGYVSSQVRYNVADIITSLPDAAPQLPILKSKANQIGAAVNSANYVDDAAARKLGGEVDMMIRELRHRLKPSKAALRTLASRLDLGSPDEFEIEVSALGAFIEAFAMEGDAEEEAYLGEALSVLGLMEAAVCREEEEGEGAEEGEAIDGAEAENGPTPGRGIFQRIQAAMRMGQQQRQSLDQLQTKDKEESEAPANKEESESSSSSENSPLSSALTPKSPSSPPRDFLPPPPDLKAPFLPPPPSLAAVVAAKAAAAAVAPPNATFTRARVTASVQPASSPALPTTDRLSATPSGPRSGVETTPAVKQIEHPTGEAHNAAPAEPNSTPPRPALTLAAPSKAAMMASLPSPKSAVPPEFLCPLSGRLIADPVVIASGLTFDRASITDWFNGGTGKGRGGRGVAVKTLEEGARLVCPVTNEALPNTQMRPNLSLRASISSWRLQNPTAALAALAPRAARAMKAAAEAAAAAEARGGDAAAAPSTASAAATADAVLSAVAGGGANGEQQRGILSTVASAAVSVAASKAAPLPKEDSPPSASSPPPGDDQRGEEHAGMPEKEQDKEPETGAEPASAEPAVAEVSLGIKKLGIRSSWSRGSAGFNRDSEAEDVRLPETGVAEGEPEAQETAGLDTISKDGEAAETGEEDEVEVEQESKEDVAKEVEAKPAGSMPGAERGGVPDFRAARRRAQWNLPRPQADSSEESHADADMAPIARPAAGPLRSRLSSSTGSLPEHRSSSVTRSIEGGMAGERGTGGHLYARARAPPLVAERDAAEEQIEGGMEDGAGEPREDRAHPSNMAHGGAYAGGLLSKYARETGTNRGAAPSAYAHGHWGGGGGLMGGATPRAFKYSAALGGEVRGAEYGSQGATPRGRFGVAAGDFTPRACRGGLAGVRGAAGSRLEPWVRPPLPAAKLHETRDLRMPARLAEQQARLGAARAGAFAGVSSLGRKADALPETAQSSQEDEAIEEGDQAGTGQGLEEKEAFEELSGVGPAQAGRLAARNAAGMAASAPLWGTERSGKGSRAPKDQAEAGPSQGGRFATYLRQSEEDSRFLEQSFSLSAAVVEAQDEELAASRVEGSEERDEDDRMQDDAGEGSEASIRRSTSSLQSSLHGLGLAHCASGVSLASSTSSTSVGLGITESVRQSSSLRRAREGADAANRDSVESLAAAGSSQQSASSRGMHSWAPLDDEEDPPRLSNEEGLLPSASARTDFAAAACSAESPDLSQNRSVSEPPAGSGGPAAAARLQQHCGLDSPFDSPARTSSASPATSAAAGKAATALLAPRRSVDGGTMGAVVGQSPASSPASSESSRSTVPGAAPADARGHADARAGDEASQLVALLGSSVDAERRSAAKRIRELTRSSAENRVKLGSLGAVHPLVALMASSLSSPSAKVAGATVEAAVYALLNLSIYDGNKKDIVSSGGLEALVHVLKTGNPSAREGAAATLFSLSSFDDNKIAIGQAGAIPMLIDVLINGTPRGQQDALLALFNLSLASCNKGTMIREGLLRHLVRVIESEPRHVMAEKSVGIILSLCSRPEGRNSLVGFKGLRALARLLHSGSKRGQEDAAAACLILVSRDPRHTSLLARENVGESLAALAEAGSARAQEKANQVLQYLGKGGRGGKGPSIPSIPENAPPTPHANSSRVSPLGAH